jgi:hypothetical protein
MSNGCAFEFGNLIFWQKAQIVVSNHLAIGVCNFGNLAKRGSGLAYMGARWRVGIGVFGATGTRAGQKAR